MMSSFSSFLFARPSYIEGVARIMDFGNTLNEYNSSLTAEQADFFAIASDWRAVGRDLNHAAAACIGPAWKEGVGVQRKGQESKAARRAAPCAG